MNWLGETELMGKVELEELDERDWTEKEMEKSVSFMLLQFVEVEIDWRVICRELSETDML